MIDEKNDFFLAINSCQYLYLKDIVEPEDNSLKIVIVEALVNDPATPIDIGANDISGSSITVSEESKVFEIYFDSYIGYSVVDESFALPDDAEIYIGRIFCIYEKSHYLKYLSKASFACDAHPGPFIHYGFNCLNHIIDIASTDKPIITIL